MELIQIRERKRPRAGHVARSTPLASGATVLASGGMGADYQLETTPAPVHHSRGGEILLEYVTTELELNGLSSSSGNRSRAGRENVRGRECWLVDS